jgi:hypothetical protein
MLSHLKKETTEEFKNKTKTKTEKMIDFSKIEAPKEMSYLKPGIYKLHPTEVKLEQPAGKSSYFNITFTGKEGIVKQKFYLTEKALPNLAYLHEGLFEKSITKSFENITQMHAYFEKALLTKVIEKTILVGGNEADNGLVYCELPFAKFFIKDEDATVGVFDKGSEDYNAVVRKNVNSNNKVDLAAGSILPDDLSDSGDNTDDLPW